MPVSDAELIKYSEEILFHDASEVSLRAAISRSYYATYHRAKSSADEVALPAAPPQYRGSHERVIHRFGALGVAGNAIAKRLQKAKMMRVRADYFISEEISFQESRLHIEACRNLFDQIALLTLVSAERGNKIE